MKSRYHQNPEKAKKSNDNLKRRIAQKIDEIKREKGCFFCPEREAVCLDFHHTNPNSKKREVSYWVKVKSMEKALKEAEKCVVVCSNCHRKVHAKLLSFEFNKVSSRIGEKDISPSS
jgi:hypothetical protein